MSPGRMVRRIGGAPAQAPRQARQRLSHAGGSLASVLGQLACERLRLVAGGLLENSQQPPQSCRQLPAVDDRVDMTVLKLAFSQTKVCGQLLVRGLLDHPRTRK